MPEHALTRTDQARRDSNASGLSPLAAGAIVATVLGISALVGRRNAPEPSHPAIDRWYHRLDKPGFTPPDAVFGAVWPVLETATAIGGYRLLRHAPGRKRNQAAGLWLVNAAAIGGWTQLFFRQRDLRGSVAAAVAMSATGAAYAIAAARVDRPAAALAVPLAGWLLFATALAEGVRRRNS